MNSVTTDSESPLIPSESRSLNSLDEDTADRKDGTDSDSESDSSDSDSEPESVSSSLEEPSTSDLVPSASPSDSMTTLYVICGLFAGFVMLILVAALIMTLNDGEGETQFLEPKKDGKTETPPRQADTRPVPKEPILEDISPPLAEKPQEKPTIPKAVVEEDPVLVTKKANLALLKDELEREKRKTEAMRREWLGSPAPQYVAPIISEPEALDEMRADNTQETTIQSRRTKMPEASNAARKSANEKANAFMARSGNTLSVGRKWASSGCATVSQWVRCFLTKLREKGTLFNLLFLLL